MKKARVMIQTYASIKKAKQKPSRQLRNLMPYSFECRENINAFVYYDCAIHVEADCIGLAEAGARHLRLGSM
jgi:hypothetical protein